MSDEFLAADPYDPVKLFQAFLTVYGFDPKGIDGKWGDGTEAAAKAFAESNPKLYPDGIANKGAFLDKFVNDLNTSLKKEDSYLNKRLSAPNVNEAARNFLNGYKKELGLEVSEPQETIEEEQFGPVEKPVEQPDEKDEPEKTTRVDAAVDKVQEKVDRAEDNFDKVEKDGWYYDGSSIGKKIYKNPLDLNNPEEKARIYLNLATFTPGVEFAGKNPNNSFGLINGALGAQDITGNLNGSPVNYVTNHSTLLNGVVGAKSTGTITPQSGKYTASYTVINGVSFDNPVAGGNVRNIFSGDFNFDPALVSAGSTTYNFKNGFNASLDAVVAQNLSDVFNDNVNPDIRANLQLDYKIGEDGKFTFSPTVFGTYSSVKGQSLASAGGVVSAPLSERFNLSGGAFFSTQELFSLNAALTASKGFGSDGHGKGLTVVLNLQNNQVSPSVGFRRVF